MGAITIDTAEVLTAVGVVGLALIGVQVAKYGYRAVVGFIK